MNDVPTDHRPAGKPGKDARRARLPVTGRPGKDAHRARLPVLESIPDAVIVSGPDGDVVFINRAAEAMTGYTRKELIGRKIEVLVQGRQRAIHAGHRRRFYKEGETRMMGGGHGGDFNLRRKDGSIVGVEISLGPAGEDTVSVIRDVTERRRMEEALEHRALHDPLTDLPNRTLFFDRLHQAINSARRQSTQLAVVMLDLDGFKAVNDVYGHAAGDVVLKIVASRLAQGLRSTDTAARIGGDEFAWILPRVASRRAVDRMIRKRIGDARDRIAVDGRHVDVGVTAGIALYPGDGRDADALIRHADAAMYDAKRNGRSMVFS